MTYTNSGLVSYCKDALKLKTRYMWGGLFREITTAYVEQLAAMYKNQYPANRVNTLLALANKGCYGCDCVGLIKSYYFGGVGVKSNAPGYVGAYDYGVDGMYNAATKKGSIGSFRKVPGQLVITRDFGHIGVYIGGDKIIECTLSSFGDGVVQTDFGARGWAYWCQCPLIEDDTSVTPAKEEAIVRSSKIIYRSLGAARKRNGAGLTYAEVGRCVKGEHYASDRIITLSDSPQKWFRHIDGTFSALTDTDGSSLFERVGQYSEMKAIAPVKLRAGAGTGYIVLDTIPQGAILYKLAAAEQKTGVLTWINVMYGGKVGWCDKQWTR